MQTSTSKQFVNNIFRSLYGSLHERISSMHMHLGLQRFQMFVAGEQDRRVVSLSFVGQKTSESRRSEMRK